MKYRLLGFLLFILVGCHNYVPLDKLTSLPESNGPAIGLNLISKDLRGLDLSHASNILLNETSFDTYTKWPRLPKDFSPKDILEMGKNPGLGIRKLHKQGINGEGISVGIIDMVLLKNHVEYQDQLVYYEEYNAHIEPELHGTAVASLLVGKSVGVAPKAKLFYIATRFSEDKCKNIAWSINRLLDINQTLKEELES